MSYVFRSLLLIFTLHISSCETSSKDTIAIDVLLTLPEEVYTSAVDLNRDLLEEHPDNFRLDHQRIPHITLLQCYIYKSDLQNVEKALDGLYRTIAKDTLWAHELQYDTSIKKSFASIGIMKSRPLLNLHQKTMELLKPYIQYHGSQNSYIQNSDGTPIDQFTIDYVPNFVEKYSFEHYNPHISLGVAKTSLLDSLAEHRFAPMIFRATSVSVYQLGAFGTAQKLLFVDK